MSSIRRQILVWGRRTLFLVGFLLLPGILKGAATSLPVEPTTEQAQVAVRSQREIRAERLFRDSEKLMEAEQYRRAAIKLESSVRLWPNFAEAHSNLGYCYRKQKLYEKAVPTYLEAIRLKPDLAEAREYLAEAYAELAAQYREKAKEELEVLRKLDPEEAEEVEKLIRELRL